MSDIKYKFFKKAWTSIVFVALINITNAQNFSWALSNGSSGNEYGWKNASDIFGNTYIIGSFNATTDLDPGPSIYTLTPIGSYDLFILKLDATGNFLWATAMGGPSSDSGGGICLDPTGNVLITGTFQGLVDFDPGPGIYNLTASGSDIFVCKLDANGNFVWAGKMGGSNGDSGYGITVDSFSNVYTTGFFSSTFADFDPGAGTANLTPIGMSDIFISKLDMNGNYVWVRRIGGSNLETAGSITVDTGGNIYAAGTFSSSSIDFDPGPGIYTLSNSGGNDAFILKLDASGNFVWAGVMGGSNDDAGVQTRLDPSGNVYIIGNFSSVNADFNPGVGTFTLSSLGFTDIFICKLDASGNFIWVKQLGGSLTENGQSIFADASGYVYTTGSFQGTADFDPTAGTNNLSSNGMNDIFINILDPSGNFYWAGQIGGANDDVGYSIIATPIGEVYTSGSFASVNTDFDCGGGTYTLSSLGNGDIFIHKMSGAPSAAKENPPKKNYLIYPNPTSNVLLISNEENNFQNSELEVINYLGQTVLKMSYSNTIDVSELSNGIYTLKIVTEDNQNFYSKFVKE